MLGEESRLHLPPPPASCAGDAVAAWREPVTIDTYLPDRPDRYPAYLDNRVYQGSSGRIYPLPFHERISPHKVPRRWDAIHLENAWVRLMVLPELGGRIHVGLDKSNGYDFFYRNNVIKPALVGLAGPWLSGGVEFNWPQHHRPATFLPVDSFVEQEGDGAVTVWCSDHDPFTRMKGMHGIRLRPDSSLIELRVRLFNRTDDVQTFLWWANMAARVNDDYQSFFPTDVHFVADHAKRAVTAFPRADRPYYGIDYAARVDDAHPDADRIDWYRNIPVPTSYMCMGTQDDFFGGYDHGVQAGFVHWADHRIAPGKKQWTWGNGPFGWAWDENLTDGDGPYVELMAGVFTDNQPDFSFLAPGETKVFSQFWYPIQRIGPAHQATRDVAVRLDVQPTGATTSVRVAAAVTAERRGLELALRGPAGLLWRTTADADPGAAVVHDVELDTRLAATDVTLVVSHEGVDLLHWTPRPVPDDVAVPEPAAEPMAPVDVAAVEELHLTALHLEQYRHATRSPEPYWLEALARDPGDTRSNVAMGRRRLRQARYAEATDYLQTAIRRQTALNPNPYDGEAYYHLGRVLERTGQPAGAQEAYGKAAWSAAWRVAAGVAMARLDAFRGADREALDRLREVVAIDAGHLQARNLAAVLLYRVGEPECAAALVGETLALDPLDWWARDLAGDPVDADAPTCLDVGLEYAACGEVERALRLLERAAALPTVPGQVAVAPLAHYHRADILRRAGRADEAVAAHAAARAADATFCLASRLDDVDMLVRTVSAHHDDARAWALLGHWLYAEHRYDDAVDAWRRSTALDPADPVVCRNLAVAAFNVHGRIAEARAWYGEALALAPDDARLLYESDQLAKRSGVPAEERLKRLELQEHIVFTRDDLTIELVELLTAAGRSDRALAILCSRRFQPWEGGEGQVLGAWDEALLASARTALDQREPARAVELVQQALTPPVTLGEARHLLANRSHLLLLLGDAHEAAGSGAAAERAWQEAATFAGDFQSMAAVPFSELTYYSALACRRLGDAAGAQALAEGLRTYVDELRTTPATVDYFATSLPSMLLFRDDPQERQETTAAVLEAQLAALDGAWEDASAAVRRALQRDPSRARARDLLRELVGSRRMEPVS